MRPNASSGEPVSQVENSLSSVSSTGLRSWLMVCVSVFGKRRHEREDLDVDVRAILLDRPLPLAIDAGECEQRPFVVAVQREPVPSRWLALIGLAEGRRGHQAPPLLEAVLPELGGGLVVARVGHALRRIAIPQQDEPPAAQ